MHTVLFIFFIYFFNNYYMLEIPKDFLASPRLTSPHLASPDTHTSILLQHTPHIHIPSCVSFQANCYMSGPVEADSVWQLRHQYVLGSE